MKNYGKELGWEVGVDFPVWGNTEEYVKTISNGYLIGRETPKDAYTRVCRAITNRLNQTQAFEDKLFIPSV